MGPRFDCRGSGGTVTELRKAFVFHLRKDRRCSRIALASSGCALGNVGTVPARKRPRRRAKGRVVRNPLGMLVRRLRLGDSDRIRGAATAEFTRHDCRETRLLPF